MSVAEAKARFRAKAEEITLSSIVGKAVLPSLLGAGVLGFLSSRTSKLPTLLTDLIHMAVQFFTRESPGAAAASDEADGPPPT